MSPIVTKHKQRGPITIELNEGEVLFEGSARLHTLGNKSDIVDTLMNNAKEIGEKTKTIFEEAKLTDKLVDGTKRIVDSSV
jgi:hypothetical protein